MSGEVIYQGEYVTLFERGWRDDDDNLVIRVNDWNIIAAEDNDDDAVDQDEYLINEITTLIVELITAGRRLRGRVDEQAT